MDKMTFPLIPAVDLVNFGRQNILTPAEAKNFTKNDIYPNPKPEWVQKIFMRALQEVYNFRMEQFYMVPVDLDIQYPHLVEVYSSLAYMMKHMASFLPMCRINDFHPSDLLNPKGKRTLYLLSGIVNFFHFRKTRLEMYSAFCMSYKSALENVCQQQKAIQELEAKKEKLTTIPPEQQAEFKTLSSEIQELQQVLSQEYRTKDMAFQEKLAQKKMEFAENSKKLNQHKLAIATMKEEQERMKSQIVESPEERKNKTERMKENVHRLKQARLETNENYEHYRERVSLAGLWLSDTQAYNGKLQIMDAGLETYRKIQEQMRQLEDQKVKSTLELKSISSEETQLKRTILMKKEKQAKIDIKHQKKLEEINQRKTDIFESCNRIQEKRQAMGGRVSQVLQEIQQTNSKKEQLIDMAERKKKEYQDTMASFKNALKQYHDNLQKTYDRSTERKREKMAELSRRLSRR
ncbi:kinetochore protein Nuf2 [Hyperolius riggenbachi]|uniref:kinetochore protein Nuf2 n=1 Tax=Hyperolius riggenbachi TaxID=752182 RepID=UPI0035A341A2